MVLRVMCRVEGVLPGGGDCEVKKGGCAVGRAKHRLEDLYTVSVQATDFQFSAVLSKGHDPSCSPPFAAQPTVTAPTAREPAWLLCLRECSKVPVSLFLCRMEINKNCYQNRKQKKTITYLHCHIDDGAIWS